MIRRHVLAALARGIAAGNDDAARAALRRIDWAIRKRAKQKLEGALIDAALATNELRSAEDPDAARHVQQAAALGLSKARIDDVTDRAKVAVAYAALPPATAPKLWFATLGLGVLAAAAVTLSLVYIDAMPGQASRVYARPLPPPAAGAYRTGGVPLGDPAIEKLLVGDFTQLVLAVDRDRGTGGNEAARKAMVEQLEWPQPIVSRGPGLANAWREMIVALDRWVGVPETTLDREAHQLRARVRTVSDQLAALGIGLYLEGDIFSGGNTAHAVVYAYRVEEVVYLKAADEPRRVLSLRRLDKLNLYHALLGMQSQELGDPVVMLDQIDRHVARHIFPVLAPEASFELDGAPAELAMRAGAAVRRDLTTALGKDAASTTRISALLAEREEIVKGWRAELHAQGIEMVSTDGEMFLPDGLLDELDHEVSHGQIDRVEEIEEELARLGVPRIASRLHELVTATVRRHEAQHGLDDDHPLRYPPTLEMLLGPATDADGEPYRRVERARAELAAYTSQIINDPATPQLAFWMVARHAFGVRSGAEFYAAVLIIDGIARQLGVPGSLVRNGRIDLDQLAARALPLGALSDERLRELARAFWRDLYGKANVPIVDK